jgi:nitroimidazol reductase NimA-like FMN-containing flavoprotein (pyridoxamine 5'-phosphate oxidase superfamily)
MKPVNDTPGIGARVTERRVSLGFDLETVAARAGMSTSYLSWVEGPHGRPSAGAVRRLAHVLHTTVEHLYGETAIEPGYLPPARSVLAAGAVAYGPITPVVSVLTPEECGILLGSVPVGRVAYVVDGVPQVLPVNFSLMGKDIVIQTTAQSRLANLAVAGRLLAFEVDDIDESSRLGWSVLLHGPSRISSEQGTDTVHANELARPWIGGDRHTVVVISPTRVTGRRIGLA